MKKCRLFLALPLSLSLLLCSCDNDNTENGVMIQNYPNCHYDMVSNVYQNGAVYTSFSESNAAYFLDYESLQSVPLCNKPNCTHSNSSCLAHQCVENSLLPIVYQNNLYWFETTSQIIDADDGQSTDYVFHTICYRADMTTGEREKFVEIPDVSMRDAVEMVIADDVLYVIGCDQAYQEKDGSWSELSRCGDQYLYAIDLTNAAVKNYGLINDAPTAHYNWTLNGAMEYSVMLTGVYQNKLYMSYRYVDRPEDIIDYVEAGDPDNPDWDDNITKIPWHRVNKCLDLETGKIENSDLPAADLIQNNGYVYIEDGDYYFRDADGSAAKCSDMSWNGMTEITFVGGKLWKGTENICFDPETCEVISLAKEYQGKDITVLDKYQGKYVIQYVDENAAYHFESVSEEDLLADE